jgi:hypothetical protein
LPDNYQGEEVFYFHAVKLLQVYACAKQGGRKKDKPITFNAGDLFPRPNSCEMLPTVTDVPTDETDLQLHSYFEKLDDRSDEIIIWEKFLQAPETPKAAATAKPPAPKSKPSSSKTTTTSSSSTARSRRKAT